MVDTIHVRLDTAEKTQSAGASLASTLYRFPIDILLSGPLGAGKTTFIQGFARALGIHTSVVSPTYALEQRHDMQNGLPFIHVDLYRLSPTQAEDLIDESDAHAGIRCIEWPDRLSVPPDPPIIHVSLDEEGAERLLTVGFDDIPLPTDAEIDRWRNEVRLPRNVADHCDKVSEVASRVADHLMQRGTIVRKHALDRAARVHDLLRFVDFRSSAEPPGSAPDAEDLRVWSAIRSRYVDMKHEAACAAFLRERGYDAVARIVEVHGLMLPPPPRVTIEQKILFYADKRVALDRIVPLEERFADFAKRYGNGVQSAEGAIWQDEARRLERELFPQGPPL